MWGKVPENTTHNSRVRMRIRPSRRRRFGSSGSGSGRSGRAKPKRRTCSTSGTGNVADSGGSKGQHQWLWLASSSIYHPRLPPAAAAAGTRTRPKASSFDIDMRTTANLEYSIVERRNTWTTPASYHHHVIKGSLPEDNSVQCLLDLVHVLVTHGSGLASGRSAKPIGGWWYSRQLGGEPPCSPPSEGIQGPRHVFDLPNNVRRSLFRAAGLWLLTSSCGKCLLHAGLDLNRVGSPDLCAHAKHGRHSDVGEMRRRQAASFHSSPWHEPRWWRSWGAQPNKTALTGRCETR